MYDNIIECTRVLIVQMDFVQCEKFTESEMIAMHD